MFSEFNTAGRLSGVWQSVFKGYDQELRGQSGNDFQASTRGLSNDRKGRSWRLQQKKNIAAFNEVLAWQEDAHKNHEYEGSS